MFGDVAEGFVLTPTAIDTLIADKADGFIVADTPLGELIQDKANGFAPADPAPGTALNVVITSDVANGFAPVPEVDLEDVISDKADGFVAPTRDIA